MIAKMPTYTGGCVHMQTPLTLRRTIVFLLLVIAPAFQATWVWSQQSGKAESKKVRKSGPKWNTYLIEKYGFRFQFPPGSSLEHRDDTGYKYIRVQNYDKSSYRKSLQPNEFYLEVFIADPALGHSRWIRCEEVDNPKRTRQGKAVIHIGRDENPGGDPGGFRRVLCVKLKAFDIWVQGTEGTWEAPTVKAILESFRFEAD
jgi:hypothetical protein